MIPTFAPASPQAHAIVLLFSGVLWILLAIFLLVCFLVGYGAIRYRASRPGVVAKQITGHRTLEIVWTALPALLLLVLFVLTLVTMHHADPPPDGRAPNIVIIGHQFWWEVRYPAAGVFTANEIHIPADQPVLLRLDAADVIHDFWVPQLGRKVDMVPGHINFLWISAHPGTYLGACSEFCGVEHAYMRLRVLATPKADFERWLKAQQQPAATPASSAAQAGQQLFQQLNCGSCHALRPAGAPTSARPAPQTASGKQEGAPAAWTPLAPYGPTFAPDLSHVASRTTLGAGVTGTSPRDMAAWLANPQLLKPECLMPNFHLDPQQVRNLSAYMESLR